MRARRIGSCWFVTGQGRHLTLFDDGTRVEATSDYGPEHVRLARSLGYTGTDQQAVDDMNADHDRTHHELAVEKGLPYSPVLWAVAHGESLDHDWVRQEEAEVLAEQRAMNRLERAA